MAYIGQGIKQGTFKVLDTSGNTYNGSNTTFNLGTQVGSAAQLLVSHDGVIQKAGTDYTLATGGTQITFSTAPASGASIFITEISGAVGGTVTPSDASVTADKLNSAILTGQTDIGGAIADADLFLTDDGAGGTLRKTAASRLKTYVGAGAGAFSIANLDIDGGTDIGADIADADLFIIDDGAGGTNRKVAASRLKTYAGGAGLNHIVTTSVSSAVGNVTFLNGSGGVTLDGTYNTYLITGTGIGLATDDTSFNMKISVDAGSNYNAQIYTSNHTVETTFGDNSASTGSQGQSSSGDVAIFAGAQGAYAGENINFNLLIFDVGSTSNKKSFTYQAVEHQHNNIVKVRNGGGIINTASDAIDGIRFAAGSGNISEGEFSLYGLAKS